MSTGSGPICHLCGLVVPAVSFAPIATSEGGADGEEVGLCPDCLRRAEEQGLLSARIIPLRGGRRPRPARRRRP